MSSFDIALCLCVLSVLLTLIAAALLVQARRDLRFQRWGRQDALNKYRQARRELREMGRRQVESLVPDTELARLADDGCPWA